MSTPNLNLAFQCRACGGCFGSIAHWHQHLLQETHLRGARQSVLKWGEGERACALIIFAKSPVGRDGRVVEYLASLGGGGGRTTIVQDFLWWEGRPKIGVAQFGSSAEVDRIVASLENKQFLIEPDLLCHVKEGSGIPEVEWEGLLPEEGEASESTYSDPTPTSPLQSTSAFPQQPLAASSSPSVTETTSPVLNPESSFRLTRSNGLRHCLISILNWIQIPKKEGIGTNDIHHSFQTLLNEYERGKGGGGGKNQLNVCLGRQWHLRFRYPPKEDLGSTPLSFILKRVIDGDAMVTFSSKEFEEIESKLFALDEADQMTFLTCCPVLSQVQGDPSSSGKVRYFSIKHPVTDKLTDVVISAEPHFVAEDQLWRLIRVLAKFDPYVFTVLAAVNYWAASNSIYVGDLEGNYMNMSDPIGLDLLILLFFQRRGLIPTCKDIFGYPHHAKIFEEADIGFSENPKHVDKWKRGRSTMDINPRSETFAEEMFTLLYEFFLFCGALLDGEDKWGSEWLLNTRDGEVIPVIDVVTGSLRDSDSKLSIAERMTLRRSLREEGNRARDRIVMLNPFSTNWRISMANAERAFGAMKETGLRLRNYMETQVHGSLADLELDEFLKLLKAEEKEIKHYPDSDPRTVPRMDDDDEDPLQSQNPPNPGPGRLRQPNYFEQNCIDEREMQASPSPSPRKRIRLIEQHSDPDRAEPSSSSSFTIHPTSPSTSTISEATSTISGATSKFNRWGGGLGDHIRVIRKLIEIPDEEHSTARDLTSRLRESLRECKHIKGLSYLASADVVMSRHWMLKLQFVSKAKHCNAPLNILICKYRAREDWQESWADDDLNKIDKRLVKLERDGKESFLSYELRSPAHFVNPRGNYTTLRYRIIQPSSRDHFDVSIRSDPRAVVEAQCWRLLEFLCTFDPRCKPLMGLTYYWAKINSVAVGAPRGPFDDLPAPSGISWLLILFLQREGIVPPTRSLLEYPHEPKLYDNMDIGFSDSSVQFNLWEDEKKPGRWAQEHHPDSEEFAADVIQLFYRFLRFSTKLGKGSGEGYGWVLNTRDGETLPMRDVLLSTDHPDPISKLTQDELVAVNESLSKRDHRRIVMLHPIFINWRISTDNVDEAIRVMRKASRKLEDYFYDCKKNGGKGDGRGCKLELEEFLQLFRVY